jgi:SAM-dependent methyltransferase
MISERAVELLVSVLDIVEERACLQVPPIWSEQRGWTQFLGGVDDETLARCESRGLAACVTGLSGAPQSLVELAAAVSDVTKVPTLRAAEAVLSTPSLREIGARKRRQIEVLLGALSPMARHASRIVDVGAGSGHLTRLAAGLFDKPALGIERSAERVERARARADEPVRYVASATRVDGLDLEPSDLAIGLHACGELGDQLTLAVAGAHCDLVLVACCPQKISAPERRALSRASSGLTLRRQALGLANLTARAHGVEAPIEETMRSRETRFALRRLLEARGTPTDPGAEMRGLNRRCTRGGLAAVAPKALALRGLAAASALEIAHFEREAHRDYGAVRRWSLPRSMLARLVELVLVLDRAAALEEAGAHVRVAVLFDSDVSPRNLALFASRSPDRLPTVHGCS